MRFQQRDWKILFVPDVTAIHRKGVSSRNRSLRVEWHKHRGMMRFYRKFFSTLHPPWMSMFLFLGVWTRFLLIAAQTQIVRIFR
jgi:GT2 family glycosyltransferase